MPLIVPRVNVEVGPQHVLQLLSPAGATDAAAAVAAEVAAAGADGIVLEVRANGAFMDWDWKQSGTSDCN